MTGIQGRGTRFRRVRKCPSEVHEQDEQAQHRSPYGRRGWLVIVPRRPKLPRHHGKANCRFRCRVGNRPWCRTDANQAKSSLARTAI